jgi:hypothetical protein
LSPEDFITYLEGIQEQSGKSKRSIQVYRQVAAIPPQRAAQLLSQDISLGAAIEIDKLPDREFGFLLASIKRGDVPPTRAVVKRLIKLIKNWKSLPSPRQVKAAVAHSDRRSNKSDDERRYRNWPGTMRALALHRRKDLKLGSSDEWIIPPKDVKEVSDLIKDLAELFSDED